VTGIVLRWPMPAMVAGLFSLLAAGCVVPGGGYDEGFGPGYYEPYGVEYGGWGGGYRVGPVRGDGGAFRGRGDRGGGHFAPSIPSRGRSGGGGHGGGGHGGGGHGGGGRR
jgi:hypothetical protein